MNPSGSEPCDLLPWDSEFFQCRIGRVRGSQLTDERASQIEEWSKGNKVRGLYFLARADDPATVRTAEKHGFNFVDIRLTFERVLATREELANAARSSSAVIRPVREEDVEGLQSIARTAHRDTRFFSDPQLTSKAEALYSTWIRLECQGRAQKVLVAESSPGKADGYVSCHLDRQRSEGQIGLIAVAEEARGRGLGISLVWSALDWLARAGAKKVTVVTQGRNQAAQRLYQKCGFLTRDLELWYHKWYPVMDSANL